MTSQNLDWAVLGRSSPNIKPQFVIQGFPTKWSFGFISGMCWITLRFLTKSIPNRWIPLVQKFSWLDFLFLGVWDRFCEELQCHLATKSASSVKSWLWLIHQSQKWGTFSFSPSTPTRTLRILTQLVPMIMASQWFWHQKQNLWRQLVSETNGFDMFWSFFGSLWDCHDCPRYNGDSFLHRNPFRPNSGRRCVQGLVLPHFSIPFGIWPVWPLAYQAHHIWFLADEGSKNNFLIQFNGFTIDNCMHRCCNCLIPGVSTASKFWPTRWTPPWIPWPTAGPGRGRALGSDI